MKGKLLKKIIYIGNFNLPDNDASAIRVLNNAKVFNELGYECICIDKKQDVDEDILQTFKKLSEGISYYSAKYPQNSKEWLIELIDIRKYYKVIERYIEELDSVIFYDYHALPTLKLKRMLKKYNVRIYCDITEWYSSSVGGLIYRIVKKIDTIVRMRYVNRKVDGLIVISDYLKEYYKDKIRNIIQIPPLVDINEIDLKFEKADTEFHKKKLIYAGIPFDVNREIKNFKGIKDRIDLIIDVLFSLKENAHEFEFNIFGITKAEYLKTFEYHRETLSKLESNVYFHGRVSHSEVIKNLKISDFMILFRDNTRVSKAGFSTKLVEGITYGIPIITNVNTDITRYLKEGKNGYLVDLNNRERCLDKLEQLMKLDDEVIRNMKQINSKSNIFSHKNFLIEFQKLLKYIKTEN